MSRSVVGHTQAGDTWRIGPPMGRLSVDRTAGQDILMVAGGTGVAPMHAIIDEMAQWGENPRVHLFYGGRTREDLYDLDNLQRIATTNPWLTVVPVLESDPGVRGVEQGTLADVVTRYGAWEDRDVLVCGSPAHDQVDGVPHAGRRNSSGPDQVRPVHAGLSSARRKRLACRGWN